jgi:hypothetical protein
MEDEGTHLLALEDAIVEEVGHLRELEHADQNLGDLIVSEPVVDCLFDDERHF